MKKYVLWGAIGLIVLAALVVIIVQFTRSDEDRAHSPGGSFIRRPSTDPKDKDDKKDDDPTDPKTDDKFIFDVVWSDEATVLDEDQRNMVLESDPEAHIYRLDARAVEAAGLDISAGRVLVIHGLALRRIADVSEEDGVLVVSTDFAALTDAIEEGTIEWDYQVRFDRENLQGMDFSGEQVTILAGSPDALSFQRMAYTPAPLQAAQLTGTNPFEVTFDMGPYKLTYKIEPKGDRLEVSITGEKGMGDHLSAKVVATGAIEAFKSQDRIVIAGGELQEYANNFDNMKGDLELSLIVKASGTDNMNFTMPVPLMQFTFLVGYMPVTLKIDTQFIINMRVPADGSSQVSTRFLYDSNMGFSFDGIDVQHEGSFSFLDMDADKHQTGASGPIAANFGIGFPRITLSMFGNTVVPWVQTAFLVGGTFTMMPPCQTADAAFLGAAGLDLKFLGKPLFTIPATTFFRVEEPLLRAGDCPD